MKKLMSTCKSILLISTFTLPFAAHAGSWFIKPYVGLSEMSDISGNAELVSNVSGSTDIDLDTGFNAGLSGGYYYNPHIAVEFGWEYRSNDSKTNIADTLNYPDGNYASSTFFINGLYHFAKTGNWQPYLGAGLVWLQEVDIDLELDGTELSYSEDGDTGYQAFLGVNYHLNADWMLQLEARYTSVTDIDLSAEGDATGKLTDLDYEPSTIQLGVVYKF